MDLVPILSNVSIHLRIVRKRPACLQQPQGKYRTASIPQLGPPQARTGFCSESVTSIIHTQSNRAAVIGMPLLQVHNPSAWDCLARAELCWGIPGCLTMMEMLDHGPWPGTAPSWSMGHWPSWVQAPSFCFVPCKCSVCNMYEARALAKCVQCIAQCSSLENPSQRKKKERRQEEEAEAEENVPIQNRRRNMSRRVATGRNLMLSHCSE
ncbi:hypothetical protein V8C42DRAFT_43690 [Trichoderma barbatum]